MCAKLCRKLVCTLLIVVPLVLSGCSGQTLETPSVPEPTSPPETETQTSSSSASEKQATASQVILNYWEAMNSYDLELALSYLEQEYREQEEEEVKGDINRLRQFSVTLSVTEILEPIYMSEDRVRHDMILETPIGDRHLTYFLVRVNGEWKIYLEDETDDFAEVREFIIEFLSEYGESQRMDIVINAEQQINMQRPTTEYALDELIELGEVVTLRPSVYSLPTE